MFGFFGSSIFEVRPERINFTSKGRDLPRVATRQPTAWPCCRHCWRKCSQLKYAADPIPPPGAAMKNYPLDPLDELEACSKLNETSFTNYKGIISNFHFESVGVRILITSNGIDLKSFAATCTLWDSFDSLVVSQWCLRIADPLDGFVSVHLSVGDHSCFHTVRTDILRSGNGKTYLPVESARRANRGNIMKKLQHMKSTSLQLSQLMWEHNIERQGLVTFVSYGRPMAAAHLRQEVESGPPGCRLLTCADSGIVYHHI